MTVLTPVFASLNMIATYKATFLTEAPLPNAKAAGQTKPSIDQISGLEIEQVYGSSSGTAVRGRCGLRARRGAAECRPADCAVPTLAAPRRP
jgi:hypothetical protein